MKMKLSLEKKIGKMLSRKIARQNFPKVKILKNEGQDIQVLESLDPFKSSIFSTKIGCQCHQKTRI